MLRKGKEICFAFGGLNQYHSIMDYGSCPAVAPSTSAVALLGLNASVELASAKRGKRTVAIKDLYVLPDANPTKFNVLEPDELLTAVIVPKPAPGCGPRTRSMATSRASIGPWRMRAWCWKWTGRPAVAPPL